MISFRGEKFEKGVNLKENGKKGKIKGKFQLKGKINAKGTKIKAKMACKKCSRP